MSSEKPNNKGIKRIKNQPVLHDELKSSRHLFLTPTTWEKMKSCAKKQGISVSELVEEWARNIEG